MAQIGLAIAGRHPGFEVFSAINWFGPEPEDRDVRGVVQGESYVSAVLGPDYDTYELVLCNFVSSSGRPEAFRILLRLPHGMALVSGENAPVAPTLLLRQVRDAIVGTTLLNVGSTLRFGPGIVRPSFPNDALATIVGTYRTITQWGGSITMLHASGHPQYVEAGEQEIPALLGALPRCRRLADASTVYFGHFLPSAQPQFRFYPEEVEAQPQIRLIVDGKPQPTPPNGAPIVLSSTSFGYSPLAYETVEITLDQNMIFNEYLRGMMSLPSPAGVQVQLMPKAGEVLVNFSPAKLKKTFLVELTTGVPGINLPADIVETKLDSAAWQRISPTGYIFQGEDIIRFEGACANSFELASRFRVVPDKNYKIEGAVLNGNTIKVTLKELPPMRMPNSTTTTPLPGPKADTSLNNQMLEVTVPAHWNVFKTQVVVESQLKNGPVDLYMAIPAEFNPTADGTLLYARVKVPSIVNAADYRVSLGIPAWADTALLSGHDGNLAANFEKRDRMGFLSKLSATFAYKYESYLRGGWKAWRIVLPLLVALLLVLLGFVLGVLASESVMSKLEQVQNLTQTVITTDTPTDTIPEAAGTAPAPESGKIIEQETTQAEVSEPISK